jgi:tight adherence protein C
MLMRLLAYQQALQGRMDVARGVVGAADPATSRAESRTAPLRLVAGLGVAIVKSGLLSARGRADLEQTLIASGFRAESALGLFIGSKIMLGALLPLVAFALIPPTTTPLMRSVFLVGSGIVGLLAPDTVVKKIRDAYRSKLERALPDALDMMVICAQAGLGLEPAITRVSYEIRTAHPGIAQELALTASEMQVMTDSRAALLRLGERTGMETMRRLTSTLAQSLQYGTPLSDALRGLAAEMRQEALTRYEERAARLPVLLTLPMILFILPCVMIVVGGPAFIQLFRALAR